MIMGKPVWAVCCGQLRNEYEFYLIISALCEYRSNGLLDGIVLSTWIGEIDNIDGLREKLEKLDVYCVELETIDISIGRVDNLNFIRQSHQLRKGLEILPDDVFVLKTRTDFAVDKTRKFGAVLAKGIDLTKNKKSVDFGTVYKFAVLQCRMFNGFWQGTDVVFLGYKNDVRLLVKSNAYRYSDKITTDHFWWNNLVNDKTPLIDELLNVFPKFYNDDMDIKIRDACLKFNLNQKLNFSYPDLLNKYFALSAIFNDECIYMIDSTKDLSNEKNNFFWQVSIDFGGIHEFVRGNSVYTPGYIALYKEIVKIKENPEYIKTWTVTDKGYEELKAFYKNLLDAKDSDFKALPKIISQLSKNKTNSTEVFSYLSGSKNKNDEYVNNVIYNYGYEYCLEIEKFLDYMYIRHNEYYYVMLATLGYAIWWNRIPHYVLKKVGYILEYDKNKIHVKNVEKIIGYLNYAYNRIFTSFESGEKLSGLYNISRYIEQVNHKSTVNKELYENLCKQLGKNLKNSSIIYSEEVRLLCKTALNEKVDLYNKNLLIHSIADFWIDEFDISELEANVQEKLKKYAIYRKSILPFRYGEEDACEKLLAYLDVLNDAEEIECVIEVIEVVYHLQSQKKQQMLLEKIDQLLNSGKICKANLMTEDNLTRIFSEDYGFLSSNVKFAILGNRFLYEQKEEAFVALKQYIDNSIKLLTFTILNHLKHDEKLHFLTLKGDELWLYYDFPQYSHFAQEDFLSPRSTTGYKWPYADMPSPYPFAMMLKPVDKGMQMSIQFSSVPCLARHYTFEYLRNIAFTNASEYEPVVEFKNVLIQFQLKDGYGAAVNYAITEFIKVAVHISNAFDFSLQQLNDNSVVFVPKERIALQNAKPKQVFDEPNKKDNLVENLLNQLEQTVLEKTELINRLAQLDYK